MLIIIYYIMGRKSKYRTYLKPFCYYCDKEYNTEAILYQHQKAKHFACLISKCSKRCSTGPSLYDHVKKMHNLEIKQVNNAINGRNSIDISIYGMDGVPMTLINYKLKLKIEEKKKKLLKEGDKSIEIDPSIKKLNKKEFLKFKSDVNFYHNPNIINITRSNDQIKALNIMYSNIPSLSSLININNSLLLKKVIYDRNGQPINYIGGFNHNYSNNIQHIKPVETIPTENNIKINDSNIPLPESSIPIPK